MEDPVLNQSLDETRELHTRWGQFRDFVLMAIKSRKVTAQAEMKFLELKSRIAMLHDGFIKRLDHDQKTGQNIMSIVADCILLKRCAAYTDAEKQKFEFDWNECYLLLTEQLGALEEEQKRLANVNIRVYRAQKRKELMVAQIHNFLRSTGLKVAVGLFVAFMLLWGIPAFGIFDYKTFGKMGWSKKPYAAFVNFVWRPYINDDLPYMTYTEVRASKGRDFGNQIVTDNDGAAKITADYFKKTTLPAMGLKSQFLTDARKYFDGNLKWDKEAYKAQNQDVHIYWIYYQEVGDAEKFVNTIVDGVKSLSEAKQKEVKDKVLLLRRANLVVIGIGNHPHRGWAGDKFYFLDKEKKDLL
ncbi:MAG: hypothetical protein ABFD69_11550 [Candidatus Sumerlaeia bacterium]